MSVVLIRSLILYIVVIFGVRLMGKRQLGELQPSELVITILISNIATLPLEDTSIPLILGILPILTLVCFEALMSWVTLKSLRDRIGFVQQDVYLFSGSVFENIQYGKPGASKEEVIAASKMAGAHEFIEGLSNGYDIYVGERGVKLSGGQRQRIAIARAILADCPVLVLDEATSALDSESEALVQDALATLMKGRTCIVVAHRLSTVASLDRIVVLDSGKVAEDGPHEQLIAAGGEYANLWNRQTGAYLE